MLDWISLPIVLIFASLTQSKIVWEGQLRNCPYQIGAGKLWVTDVGSATPGQTIPGMYVKAKKSKQTQFPFLSLFNFWFHVFTLSSCPGSPL